MATKILFFVLLLVCSFSMRVPENDPQRNKTIIKVLSAYCNIGVQKTGNNYAYLDSMTFARRAEQFLNCYQNQSVKAVLAEQLSLLKAHKKNLNELKRKAQQLINSTKADEELQFASEIVAELDSFYFQVYGINTTSPDKYIGLLDKNRVAFAPLEPAFDSMRSIFGIPAVKDLPQTYQYFHSKAKKYTSQLDQDGIIEAIFQLIGTRNKFFVEIGGGNSNDNTVYLRNQKKWYGLLFNSGNYIARTSTTGSKLIMEMVAPEKAVQIFQKYEVPKQLDFLSVDIDGNDYWVTKALLQYYRPAAISVEFNSNFPGTVSATIKPNQSQFVWKNFDKIYGVSARAVYELGKEHGYSYVYHLTCTDIFLVRDDLLPVKFRGMNLEDTYDAYPIWNLNTNMQQFQILELFSSKYKKQNHNDSTNISKISLNDSKISSQEKAIYTIDQVDNGISTEQVQNKQIHTQTNDRSQYQLVTKEKIQEIVKNNQSELSEKKSSPQEQSNKNAKKEKNQKDVKQLSQKSMKEVKQESQIRSSQIFQEKVNKQNQNSSQGLNDEQINTQKSVSGQPSSKIKGETEVAESLTIYLYIIVFVFIILLIAKRIRCRISIKKKEKNQVKYIQSFQAEEVGQESQPSQA